MKKTLFTLFLLVCALWCFPDRFLAGPAGFIGSPSVSDIQLIVSTDKSRYEGGERINLRIVITNGSSQTFELWQHTNFYEDFTYQIVGDDKKEVPLTRWGRALLGERRWLSPSVGFSLRPGETHANVVVLNQLFDLTFPQHYEIKVSKATTLNRNATNANNVVVSAPVEFYVSE